MVHTPPSWVPVDFLSSVIESTPPSSGHKHHIPGRKGYAPDPAHSDVRSLLVLSFLDVDNAASNDRVLRSGNSPIPRSQSTAAAPAPAAAKGVDSYVSDEFVNRTRNNPSKPHVVLDFEKLPTGALVGKFQLAPSPSHLSMYPFWNFRFSPLPA